MRKVQLLMLTALAVLAFSVISTSAALAKEWLLSGAAIAVKTASKTESELLLEDMKSTPAVIDILCSVIFIGTVGPGAADEVTLVEGLSTEDNVIDCVAHELCENNLATVTAVNLPWSSAIILMANGEILDIYTGTGGEPGYEAVCKTILGTFADECLAEGTGAQAVLKNEATDVFGEFSENEAITPPGKCSNGGVKEGLVVGGGLTIATGGGTLSIS
jgi:hypothetical protein